MQFKSLRTQIIVVFLTLVLGIQLAGLIPVQYSINKNAQTVAQQDLNTGEQVFKNILEHNTDSLKQGAKILAADYGFRESIATLDQETIASALNNHQSRINADIAIYYATVDQSLVVSGKVSTSEAKNAVQSLIQRYSIASSELDFEIFNEVPYQLVAVPVKAPLTIGWVVMGFKIDGTLVNQLHKLSNLEVTFLQKAQGQPWQATASTLSSKHMLPLITLLNEHYQAGFKDVEIEMGNELYAATILTLHHGDKSLVTVLQRSISQTTAQFSNLQYSLIVLTVIGLAILAMVIIYTSKYITKPITNLSEIATRLGQGEYHLNVHTDRKDEIGQLSQAFNAMSEAIAERERKVYRLAFIDELTELPNRQAFMKLLGEEIALAKSVNQHLAIIVLNLDRFKQINKIMGRHFADELLRHIARRLQASIIDTHAKLARLGADEYAILVPDTDAKKSLLIAQNLLKIFEQSQQVESQNIDLSVGIGLSIYPLHGDTDEQLLHNAETALQSSKLKSAGVVVYDAQLEAGLQENLTLASELRDAIKHDQLSLYLQPKILLHNKQALAAEALVRWIHPQKGFIFPDQFIPFAEQTGLIQHITHWMLNEACKTVAQLQLTGIALTVAVNISTRDLIDQTLPDKLNKLLHDYEIGVESIVIEITESSIMDDPVRAETTLAKLSQMGIKIAIDDFGTGYSSLGYLKRLPVQELKIDKSFVLNMEKNENDATIVKSTIDLGHNLNLKVVAEGVENIETWRLLITMGCDYGQGYFMGKPMPVKEFPAWHLGWQSRMVDLA